MTISWLRYTARHNTGDIKKTEKKVEKNKEDSKKKGKLNPPSHVFLISH